MITEKISVSNDGKGIDDALALAQKTAGSMSLNRKETFHLRLLAEEMLGMIRTITGSFTADFWLETEGRKCSLHLVGKSDIDYQKRRELLSVSTTGKNIASVGIMDKIRNFIEAGLFGIDESFRLQAEYGAGLVSYGALGIVDSGMTDALYSWSMQKYKSDVENERANQPEAWDELEKSIIANIADEVQAGVSKDRVELIITKTFK